MKKVSRIKLKFGVHVPRSIARAWVVVTRLSSFSIKSYGLVKIPIQNTSELRKCRGIAICHAVFTIFPPKF